MPAPSPRLIVIVRLLAMSACVAFAFPTAGFAASFTFAQVLVQEVDENNNAVGGSTCFDFTSTSGATVGCSGSLPIAGVSTLTYLASSSAEQGILKVLGSQSIANPGDAVGSGGPSFYNTTGTALFRDEWTITGGSGTGTLEFQFDVTGTFDFGDISTSVFTGLGFQNLTASLFPPSNGSFPDYSASFTTPFTFGEMFEFVVSLTAGSGLSDLETGGYDGQSSAMNLSSTAILKTLIVKDGAGNVVPFNLSTGSGASLYQELVPPSGAPVPEPASMVLFGAGLVGMGVHRWRRRRAQ